MYVMYSPPNSGVGKCSSTTDTLYVGGTELNTITGERLKDLFTTAAWQDHFTFLSDSLGFSLSIYSQDGNETLRSRVRSSALPGSSLVFLGSHVAV